MGAGLSRSTLQSCKQSKQDSSQPSLEVFQDKQLSFAFHNSQYSLIILSSELGFSAQYACYPGTLGPHTRGRAASDHLVGNWLVPTAFLMLTQPVHGLLRTCMTCAESRRPLVAVCIIFAT